MSNKISYRDKKIKISYMDSIPKIIYKDKIYQRNQEPPQHNYIYNWDFTESLVDSVAGKSMVLNEGAVRTSNGIEFTGTIQQAQVTNIVDLRGKTIEVDMGPVDYKGGQVSDVSLQFIETPIHDSSVTIAKVRGYGLLAYRKAVGWSAWGSDTYNSTDNRHWGDSYSQDLEGTSSDVLNAFSNKTIKIVINSTGDTMTLYLDDVLKGTVTGVYAVNETKALAFNNSFIYDGYKDRNSEARFYDSIIKALRIYENE